MINFKSFRVFVQLLLIIIIGNISLASEHSLIESVHSQPPSPCISKSLDDKSSLIAINPAGENREDIINHMGAFSTIFLSVGTELMSSKHVEKIYTAVFYENEPINEVGIYGYRFKESINTNQFKEKDEFNGSIFIINNKLLVVVWHEDIHKTNNCYSAIKDIFNDL